MPPLPPAGDVLRISLGYVQNALNFGNRFYITYSGGTPSAADCVALATSVKNAWAAQLQGAQSNTISLTSVEVMDLSSSTAAFGLWEGALVGGVTSAPMPASAALVIEFEIARRYRGGKPKIFLPLGVSADMVAENAWATSFTSLVATAWQDFFTAILATTGLSISLGSHCSVSYYSGFTVVTNPTTGRARNVAKLRPTPEVSTVTTHIVRNSIGSQRKRLRLKT